MSGPLTTGAVDSSSDEHCHIVLALGIKNIRDWH